MVLSLLLSIIYEKFSETIDFIGGLMGASPPMPKNGHFKAEGLNIGWVGKI